MKDKFTLEEIAGWCNTQNSEIEIPPLQRGLVWKPKQVELLWDSILRGFPIGSFMLSEGKEQTKSYSLLDGQQRYNAIAIAYNNKGQNKDESILWIDIKHEKNNNRKFWIKASTSAHPWGYDDEHKRLSAGKCRTALNDFGLSESDFYTDGIDLKQAWPVCSDTPIPLFLFLEADTTSEDSFVQDIIARIEKYKNDFTRLATISYEIERDKIKQDEIKQNIKALYGAFKRLKLYTISVNILSQDVLTSEDDGKGSDSEITALETLFYRLNTGGTQITSDELSYSAIKAYWHDIEDLKIKEENRRVIDIRNTIALESMPPEKLAMLVFRLALINTDKPFQGNIKIAKIRELSPENKKGNEKNSKYQEAVIEIYKKLRDIMRKIDIWLGVNDNNDNIDYTPKILRTSIARGSSDIFLLLMYFADKAEIIDPRIMRGLAFYLHWFAIDKKKCAEIVLKEVKETGNVQASTIDNALYSAMRQNFLLYPYTPTEVSQFMSIKDDKNWRPWSDGNSQKPWWNFWDKFIYQKECILYAERKYLNSHFKRYNPARKDLWESHNRPWDYDHIVPQEWMYNKRNAPYLEYCKAWKDYNGNFAAISFTSNRAKSNSDNFEEYQNNPNLLFDPALIKKHHINNNITRTQEAATKFAEIVYQRSCSIYDECSQLWNELFKSPILKETLLKRKQIIASVCKNVKGSKIHFVYGDREFPLVSETDWCREWISVGILMKPYYIGICMPSNATIIEIGIRKYPDETKISEPMNQKISSKYEYEYQNSGWWYLVKADVPVDTPIDEITDEINNLVDHITY